MKKVIKKIATRIISSLLPPKLMTNNDFFYLWESRGYHVTPVHFYQPIPDTRELKEDMWSKYSDLVGIDMNEEFQINLLSQFSSQFKKEYDNFPEDNNDNLAQYYINNGMFESVDGEVLYCMIRLFKPRIIMEIGSGNSTYLSAQAIKENEKGNGHKCKLIAIEPYPNDVLKKGFPGLSRLVSKRAQDIPLSEFGNLTENDILFIDSSHVLKMGSDVQYIFLEILPRLNKGVIVHIHDIFLPAEYPRDWVLGMHKFYGEQYLLQAFLMFNHTFEVLWVASYMHLKHPDKLEEAFRSYRRDKIWPGSFWIRKIK